MLVELKTKDGDVFMGSYKLLQNAHLLIPHRILTRAVYFGDKHNERIDYIDYGYLSILREGMKKLYSDYLILNKKYPVIHLGWKGKRILKSFNISNRIVKRTKGNQNMIYSILQNEFLSVNQLADRISMTRQGVRYHIHNLLKHGKIKLIDDSQLNWLYGV